MSKTLANQADRLAPQVPGEHRVRADFTYRAEGHGGAGGELKARRHAGSGQAGDQNLGKLERVHLDAGVRRRMRKDRVQLRWKENGLIVVGEVERLARVVCIFRSKHP